jgi:hypothetical protein
VSASGRRVPGKVETSCSSPHATDTNAGIGILPCSCNMSAVVQSQKMLMEMDNRVHSLHEQLDIAQSAFTRQLDDIGHSITGITGHLKLPRSFIEELESLETQLHEVTHKMETLSAAALVQQQRKFEAELSTQRSTMQQELRRLARQLSDAKSAAGEHQGHGTSASIECHSGPEYSHHAIDFPTQSSVQKQTTEHFVKTEMQQSLSSTRLASTQQRWLHRMRS